MRWKFRVRFLSQQERRAYNHKLLMKAAAEEGMIVRSNDQAYSIRLDAKIKESTGKISGLTVAVYTGTLLLRVPTVPTITRQVREREILEFGIATHSMLRLMPDSCGVPRRLPVDRGIIVKIFTFTPGVSSRAETEIASLKRLTARGCKHAPEYLGDFQKTTSGGVTHYVLMTKVPGVTLSDMPAYNFFMSPFWRSKAKIAFDEAIRAVHGCGVYNGSPYKRNVLWDHRNGICYIVDYERAELRYGSAAGMPAHWADFQWWMDDDKGSTR